MGPICSQQGWSYKRGGLFHRGGLSKEVLLLYTVHTHMHVMHRNSNSKCSLTFVSICRGALVPSALYVCMYVCICVFLCIIPVHVICTVYV